MGSGDLSGLNEAQEELRRFHENLEDVEDGGPPDWVYSLLKWIAFLIASFLVGWLLYRVFRFRRLLRNPGQVEETRESLFTWGKANDDLFGLVGGWWNNLVLKATAEDQPQTEPENPRELYHSFLELSESIGHPKAEEQTPREHQDTLEDSLPPAPVDRIVDGFQVNYYGNRNIGTGGMAPLLQDWAILRQHEAEQREQRESIEKDTDADGKSDRP